MGLFNSRTGDYTLEARPRDLPVAWRSGMKPLLHAEVSLDIGVREIANRLFTYEIPEELATEVFIGTQVLVPFGNQDLVSGYVITVKEPPARDSGSTEAGRKLRQISDVLDGQPLFDKSYIEFLYWIADYYACSITEVLQAAIPAEVAPRIKRRVRLSQAGQPEQEVLFAGGISASSLGSDEHAVLSVLESASGSISMKALKDRCRLPVSRFYKAVHKLKRRGKVELLDEAKDGAVPKLVSQVVWTGNSSATPRQAEIVNVLRHHNGGMLLPELIKSAKTTSATIHKMVEAGILTIVQTESMRDPLEAWSQTSRAPAPEPTVAQSEALKMLTTALNLFHSQGLGGQTPSFWLLHGVTGSGKTEIYIRLIERILSQGGTAMLLVPEISLTPQLAQRLVSRLGSTVAVWHSGLSAGERFDTWRRIQAGDLRVVLGARSAILLRIPNLALIILDEEHDGSYKQSSPSPRYSAKRLALERSAREGAFVLFGSATPDAATYFQAKQMGSIVELRQRVLNQPLPESVIVDMRQDARGWPQEIFAEILVNEMSSCLERQEQMILLINRRGYASHLFCRACGDVLKCRHCSVSLVYHHNMKARAISDEADAIINGGRFTCHHCNFTRAASEICPACTAPFLKQAGIGTQRVESETRRLFPQARILRLDSDVTARKGAYEEVFRQFAAGEADILIGTQMIAKGIDVHGVTLVGVLAADAAFNLPDYRSLERGFQLLTQVSGRAGRGQRPGRVILQTFNPELPALDLARRQDYNNFVEQELDGRREFFYPPFSQLIRVVFSGEDEFDVEAASEGTAESLSHFLDDRVPPESVRILGPASCLIERVKGMYRYQILIKNLAGEPGRALVTDFLRQLQSRSPVRITIDVDPMDLV